MNDSLKRGLRTFIQAALGIVLLQAAALAGDAEDGVIDVDLWRRVLITALVAGVIAVVSWAHNYVEDATGKTALK